MKRIKRPVYLGFGIGLGLAFIVLLDIVLSTTGSTKLAQTLLGKFANGAEVMPYPLSIQNIMWIMFFVSLCELLFRMQESRAARKYLRQQYLPKDDDNTVLQTGDLTPIFTKVRDKVSDEAAMLPRLIYHTILQFENSKSIDASANLLNSQMEYLSHQLELRYTTLRYLVWLIPTLGFIGTVLGIALTLANINPDSTTLLKDATTNLAVAFDTTLLALIQSAVIVYIMHVTQEKEEHCLNLSGQNCLNNLINRLYVGTGDSHA